MNNRDNDNIKDDNTHYSYLHLKLWEMEKQNII